MTIKDLDYYRNLFNGLNDISTGRYVNNSLIGSTGQNYSYTHDSGVVLPIVARLAPSQDPISGYNSVNISDIRHTNITSLVSFQTQFLTETVNKLTTDNNEYQNYLSTAFGVPRDGLSLMLSGTRANAKVFSYIQDLPSSVQDDVQNFITEIKQNEVVNAVLEKEKSFINDILAFTSGPAASFALLPPEEQALFIDILNTYDELVTDYQSAIQRDKIDQISHEIPADGFIGKAFSDTNLAALKLNKAKDMLTMLKEGMSLEHIKIYETAYDYEIGFTQKITDSFDTSPVNTTPTPRTPIPSGLARQSRDYIEDTYLNSTYLVSNSDKNLAAAKIEASRQLRSYIESVHILRTSTEPLDQALVATWTPSTDPLKASIITNMKADIIDSDSLTNVQALFNSPGSSYIAAKQALTSKKEMALELTDISDDGKVNTTELAILLQEAYANSNMVDGIQLSVLKAALNANGVSTTTLTDTETLVNNIAGTDQRIDFNDALAAFNSFNISSGKVAFDNLMSVLAATRVDPATDPGLFNTVGGHTFFKGDYSTLDKAILSNFLASSGRFYLASEETESRLGAYRDVAGVAPPALSDIVAEQRTLWQNYLNANHAQGNAKIDIGQDNSLAWSFNSKNS